MRYCPRVINKQISLNAAHYKPMLDEQQGQERVYIRVDKSMRRTQKTLRTQVYSTGLAGGDRCFF